MGFWGLIKDSIVNGVKDGLEESKRKENVELGYRLFLSMSLGSLSPDDKYAAKVSRIKKELNNERIPIFIRAAELIGEPTTAKELYTVAHAYLSAGASVRDKAILYMEQYITAGACWEETPSGIQNDRGIRRDLRNTAISYEHISLGKLYEAEYRFDDAMEQYQIANQLCPYDAAGIVNMSSIYCKRGDYEGGIQMFTSVLKSKYYRVYIHHGEKNCDFVEIVDRAYNDLLEKQQTGYVYRPRKKKPASPPSNDQ